MMFGRHEKSECQCAHCSCETWCANDCPCAELMGASACTSQHD